MTAVQEPRFRLSAVLLGLYAVVMIANAILYASWIGNFSGLTPRFWMRLLFLAALIYGLWQSARWARWLTIVFGLAMGAAGLFGVWAASRTGLFDDRPYPILDYSVLVITSLALLGAATVLLLPRRTDNSA
jgi:hypothetical protein